MLEAYAVLSFLAATTHCVRLGAMVSPVTFRPPALLIKTVTTLDVLSAGRAWLGLGAGYQETEARNMGVPLPPSRQRFEHLTDTVRLAAQMWRGDTTPFHGVHARLELPVSSPRPVTTPHPPVLIGGRASSAHCAWSPSTRTRATCSTSRTATSPSGTSWPCCATTARRSAATTPASSRRRVRPSATTSRQRISPSAARN